MPLNAYIVECVRTPAGKNRGKLSEWQPADLGAVVLDELVKRANIDPAAGLWRCSTRCSVLCGVGAVSIAHVPLCARQSRTSSWAASAKSALSRATSAACACSRRRFPSRSLAPLSTGKKNPDNRLCCCSVVCVRSQSKSSTQNQQQKCCPRLVRSWARARRYVATKLCFKLISNIAYKMNIRTHT